MSSAALLHINNSKTIFSDAYELFAYDVIQNLINNVVNI